MGTTRNVGWWLKLYLSPKEISNMIRVSDICTHTCRDIVTVTELQMGKGEQEERKRGTETEIKARRSRRGKGATSLLQLLTSLPVEPEGNEQQL